MIAVLAVVAAWLLVGAVLYSALIVAGWADEGMEEDEVYLPMIDEEHNYF